MNDQNEWFRSLNAGLPDDVERLKAAGYYREAIARIEDYLAEDWTQTQNSPRSQGLDQPGGVLPENPTPRGVDALREALLVQKEILRRIPEAYCYNEAQAVARMQGLVRDFTVEEFRQLVREGRVDWRFVEGEKHFLDRFAETLLATHADLAARQIDPPVPSVLARERHRRVHEQMQREGKAEARITLKTSVGMSDAAFEKLPLPRQRPREETASMSGPGCPSRQTARLRARSSCRALPKHRRTLLPRTPPSAPFTGRPT